jgi:hypothetical protein
MRVESWSFSAPAQMACRWTAGAFASMMRAYSSLGGGHAQKLGWSSQDLLGLHPTAPMERHDQMGLLWSLRGKTVTDLDAKSAKAVRRLLISEAPVTAGSEPSPSLHQPGRKPP